MRRRNMVPALALAAALLNWALSSSMVAECATDPVEVVALRAFKREIGDVFNRLSNWEGNDPCNSKWTGVLCNGTEHVHELRLLNMNFTGALARDLGNLTELVVLNVMWNNITGPIPREIGHLSNLYLLLLNGNKLSGTIPSELGNLSKLNRLQIDSNNMSGSVPSSFQHLNKLKHMHLNNNSLDGSIPKELGRMERLYHLLLDNNKLSGVLPSELSNLSTLAILQLDNNQFQSFIPSDYSNMTSLEKLSLRNCSLTGAVPRLTSLTNLKYLDLSRNSLGGKLPSGSLPPLMTTVDLSYNQLDGEVPINYYQIAKLELLNLRNNSLDGDIAEEDLTHEFLSANSTLIFDFQNNNIIGFIRGIVSPVGNITFRLFGNPVCRNLSVVPAKSCTSYYSGTITDNFKVQMDAPSLTSCTANSCDISRNQEPVYGLIASGQCRCAYPLIVRYRLKSPSFVNFIPYQNGLQQHLSSGLNLLEYQVHLSDWKWEPGPRLAMTIKLFPSSSDFSQAEVSDIYDTFVTWSFPDNSTYGPYELIAFIIGYPYNESHVSGSQKRLSKGAIAGIVIGAVVLTANIVALSTICVIKHQHPYANRSKTAQQHKYVNMTGLKCFSYDEMARATGQFDNSNQIGRGGYGTVYKGVLDDGLVVAIKRAQVTSLQGSKEFFTEIELLSRIHHRNLVSLIGYCFHEGEQMLVFEFMANGALRDVLNAQLKEPLSFSNRLQIALGSAKGILYLHTEANPPIYHRDIKASNILLDEKRKPKVADFGISKLAPVPELEGDAGGYVSTVVKGTPGYLDPEYFLTHKLTDKSDVYSFGVVLLELLTGRQPIYQGKNLVREVNLAYRAGTLLSFIDPQMGSYPSECLEPLVRLALSCSHDDPDTRPSMSEVVRGLEAIWRLAPLPDNIGSFEISMEAESGIPKYEDTPELGTCSRSSSFTDRSGLVTRTLAPR